MADIGTGAEAQTSVGGLRAVEMLYRGIREIETGSVSFFQSKTMLNTPDLGTLSPEGYRDVAELTGQCLTLFGLEMMQALDAGTNFREREFSFRWLSVYMPIRFLTEKGYEARLIALTEEAETDTNRICFELSSALLMEGTSAHSKAIDNLRNRGFHFMLTGFGGPNSPLMKLSEYPVDYVLMSQEITSYLGKSERSGAAVGSIVEFIHGLEAEAIADGVSNANQAEALYRAGCRFIAGGLAGKYTQERYIRKRTEGYLDRE